MSGNVLFRLTPRLYSFKCACTYQQHCLLDDLDREAQGIYNTVYTVIIEKGFDPGLDTLRATA